MHPIKGSFGRTLSYTQDSLNNLVMKFKKHVILISQLPSVLDYQKIFVKVKAL
jgi:hypothetical protein